MELRNSCVPALMLAISKCGHQGISFPIFILKDKFASFNFLVVFWQTLLQIVPLKNWYFQRHGCLNFLPFFWINLCLLVNFSHTFTWSCQTPMLWSWHADMRTLQCKEKRVNHLGSFEHVTEIGWMPLFPNYMRCWIVETKPSIKEIQMKYWFLSLTTFVRGRKDPSFHAG